MSLLWKVVALFVVVFLGKVEADPWLDDDFEYASVPKVWVKTHEPEVVRCFSNFSKNLNGGETAITKISAVSVLLCGLIGFYVYEKCRRYE